MIDKNYPAFPHGKVTLRPSSGMTMRDYFAAKAMQSMCDEVSRYDQFESVARDAYKMADAMLEAREM